MRNDAGVMCIAWTTSEGAASSSAERKPRRGITEALRSGRSIWGDLIAPHKKPHGSRHVEMCDPDAARVENRPAFRKAFERRRCLVPVDNFYEWKKTERGKQPYAIALADRGIMALAGLWENWHSPTGEWVRSFAIITTTPNELCAELHNRMPVVLKPDVWPAWLGEQPATPPVREVKGRCWPRTLPMR